MDRGPLDMDFSDIDIRRIVDDVLNTLLYLKSGTVLIACGIGLITSLLTCLFGWRMKLFFVWLKGTIIGAGFGILVGIIWGYANPESTSTVTVIAAIIGAAIGGGLAIINFWISVFMTGFWIAAIPVGIVLWYMMEDIMIALGVGVLFGIIAGVIWVKVYPILYRVLSSISGGFGVGACIAVIIAALIGKSTYVIPFLLGREGQTGWLIPLAILTVVIGIFMSVIGIRVQFGMGVGVPWLDRTGRSPKAEAAAKVTEGVDVSEPGVEVPVVMPGKSPEEPAGKKPT